MDKIVPSQRVVIIGAGNVGSTAAFSILTQEVANEIILIDINEELGKSQVLDMQDAADFTQGVEVSFGSYDDLINGDVVVITCGAAQKEGQTRLDLLNINAKIIRDVVSKIKATGKIVYVLMVTNPVDILTYIAVTESGLPKGMVFGSGTYLDSARLRVSIADELNVSTANVHAYILGEHGDSSFPAISGGNIAGIKLEKFYQINDELYDRITEKVRDKAYDIINGKGATYYGIGSAVARIVKSIINNDKRIAPVSIMLNGEYGLSDLSIGVPAMIDSEGAKIIGEISLNDKEREMLNKSAEIIKENISHINNSSDGI